MEYSEKWGRDVEEATALALIDLKLTRDQVEIVVLEEPVKGFLGIGSKLAKVRVQKSTKPQAEIRAAAPQQRDERPQKREEREDRTEKKEVAAAPEKRDFAPKRTEDRPRAPQADNRGNRPRPEYKEQRPKEDVSGPSITNIRIRPENMQDVLEGPALDFLRDITEKMGLELAVRAMENEECIYFDISGKDSGSIIGKRGQTLDSIQYLTSLVVNKDSAKYTRVIVDAENYRQKRERTLEQLANRLADKVRRTGKSVRLEPMNPYERKVIHATLQKNPAVTTRSEGEEPYRRVIIEQK